MILEWMTQTFGGILDAILGVFPEVDLSFMDVSPVVSMAMTLDAHLPVHEVLSAAVLVIAFDLVLWLFDTFDWLYTKLPLKAT